MKNKTKIIGIAVLVLMMMSSTAIGINQYQRTNQVLIENGTPERPGLAFEGETNTGIWRPTNGNVVLSIMGNNVWTWSTSNHFCGIPLTMTYDNWIGFGSGNKRIYSQDSWNLNIISNENLNLECEQLSINGHHGYTGKITAGQVMYVENGLIVEVK